MRRGQNVGSLQNAQGPEQTSFRDNIEFLEAKQREFSFLVECAALRRAIELAEKEQLKAKGFLAKERSSQPGEGIDDLDLRRRIPKLKRSLRETVKKYETVRIENIERLSRPRQERFPFEDLAEQCGLGPFEQDVVWLLFLKAVSPDFQKKYEDAGLNTFDYENNSEMYIGNLLQILCPGSLREQMKARKHFSVDAPLLRHHLVKLGRDVEDCATILEVELELPQRVIGWISEDTNTYVVDSPFHIECPATTLSQVILPQEQIDRVLALVENYDSYVQKRHELHLDEAISYGRAIVILEYGVPGTGKTMLGRALSNHTRRPLVSFKQGDEHGGGLRHASIVENIPKLFREAQLRKGIVFIDECEQFCSRESVELPHLLIELERTDAVVIMATNKPEELAPALDRRFTLKIPFQMPDADKRRRIWEVHIPKDVPVADDVDVEYLACAYPLAGGYIKNAVLTAVNLALSRDAGKGFLLRQVDLEKAAQLQERHVGGACLYREIVNPRVTLDDALISESEREASQRLVRMVRNYRKLVRKCSWNGKLASNPLRGIRALFHSISLHPPLQAVEGVAGHLGVSMNRVLLHRVIEDSDVLRKSKIAELFSTFSGTGQLLVLVDDRDFLNQLGDMDDGTMRELFDHLARYEGVSVVVSSADKLRLPGWANIFHEKLFFDRPTGSMQNQCWKKFLNGALPLADDVNVERLVRDYDLSLDEIQASVHRACLLLAAEDSNGTLNAETLRRAIRLVTEKSNRQERLFG